jgi:thiamine-phosphate pyrophosphorylase
VQGLYLVTDRGLCGGRPLGDVVRQAVQGGVCCVQLREKDISTREFIELAAEIRSILCPSGIPLIINDRIDVALAVGAEGVHIGQGDMPYEAARRILGRSAIIGLSVETWEDVEMARDLDVDYLGVSPVFPTPTKTDTRGAWGVEGLVSIRAHVKHPLVAIGGLNRENAAAVVRAGADCIAVVSAICSASDPMAEAKKLSAIIREALETR